MQILDISHQMLVSLDMRGQLKILDASTVQYADEEKSMEEHRNDKMEANPQSTRGPILPPSNKYHLGACQKHPLTLDSIENEHANDIMFKDFWKNLTVFINNYVAVGNVPLPPNILGMYIRLPASHEVNVTVYTSSLTNFINKGL